MDVSPQFNNGDLVLHKNTGRFVWKVKASQFLMGQMVYHLVGAKDDTKVQFVSEDELVYLAMNVHAEDEINKLNENGEIPISDAEFSVSIENHDENHGIAIEDLVITLSTMLTEYAETAIQMERDVKLDLRHYRGSEKVDELLDIFNMTQETEQLMEESTEITQMWANQAKASFIPLLKQLGFKEQKD